MSSAAASRGTLREHALDIFGAGVAAADPSRAVRDAIRALRADGRLEGRDLRVVAFGKAAVTMATAAAEALGDALRPGHALVVVNHENARAVEGVEVLPSGHPMPDAAGVEAASCVREFVSGAGDDGLTLVLISGGGSAILPAPAAPLTLEDKQRTTEILLASGAPIDELNCVRKHLSYLKGGGLARCAAPARVESLILSDVIGDDLSVIASGPTVADPTTFADCRAVLAARGAWIDLPAAVRDRVEAGCRGEIDDTPKPGDPIFDRVEDRLVGSNGQSLDASAKRAAELGYEVEIVDRALVGEARDAGEALARRLEATGGARRPVAMVAGGETTVTVRGAGRGGRNQEMAAAFARAATTIDVPGAWAFLSAGTDGIDGPTDAAGGLVDAGTLARAAAAGADVDAALRDNDAYSFLSAAGDLLVTGATGTNVADLQVLLRA